MQKVPPEMVRVPGLHSPRRRAGMLALITLVALVPIGVGVGVSQLAGHPARPGSPKLPASPGSSNFPRLPSATIGGALGSVTIFPGGFTWDPGGRHVDADHVAGPAVVASEPVIRVLAGDRLQLSFSVGASGAGSLSSASLALDQPGAPSHPLSLHRPIYLPVDERRGIYPMVVHTTWGAGQAAYYLRVNII